MSGLPSRSIQRARGAHVLERVAEIVIHGVALAVALALVLVLIVLWMEAVPLFTSSEVHAEVTPGALFATDDARWTPLAEAPRFSLLPLLVGSLKISLVALLFGAPVSIGAALYVSELASRRARELIKPAIELLAGVPSVIIGFVVLATLASRFGASALVAGVGVAFAMCPIVFTITEGALRAVPQSYRTAAVALGSTRAQMLSRVVIPAAGPGILGGVTLGLGRALGETMIVALVSGNDARLDGSLTSPARAVTATIALEGATATQHSAHHHVLFALGTILFVATFVINLLGERVVLRMRRKLVLEEPR